MQKKYIILCLGCVAFASVLAVLHQSGILTEFQADELKNTVLEFGVLAPIVYILFYALASLLFIPGSPITLVGGALFGSLYGTLYTIVGATIGALLAFTLSRTLGRMFVSFGTGTVSQKLRVYDERIAQHGFLVVLFLRFVPLFPFNGLNFALGLTKVSYKDYFFGTVLGIIPGTFVYVYFGDSLATLNPLKIGGAVALIVMVSFLGRYVHRRFDSKRIHTQ
jgi:uncharacterized membrane protein YdjX (TVP38/TMEM64 family)